MNIVAAADGQRPWLVRLTAATRLALALAAREASRLGREHLEVEHLFIGLCTADGLSIVQEREVPGLTPPDRKEALREGGAFLAALRRGGLDPERARLRLRELCLEDHRKRGAFAGQFSLPCRSALERAAELADGEIAIFCLATGQIGVDCLAYVLVDTPGPLLARVLAEQEASAARLMRALTGCA